jgi:hypothetical protein
VLGAFMVALTAHFVFEASAWWLLTALPVVAVIVDSAFDMGWTDKIVQALALRWLKGKADSARKGGSTVFKALDGNNRLIVVIGFILAGLYTLATGHDVRPMVESILRAMNWSNPDLISEASKLATQIVPLLYAMGAAGWALWKMWKQRQAGASLAEINGPIGVLKAAAADGTLTSRTSSPVVLHMSDVAPTEAKSAPVVASVVVNPAPLPPAAPQAR